MNSAGLNLDGTPRIGGSAFFGATEDELDFGGLAVNRVQGMLTELPGYTTASAILTPAHLLAIRNFNGTGGFTPSSGQVATRQALIGAAQTNVERIMNSAGLNLDGTPR
jgi:hypothetical protein